MPLQGFVSFAYCALFFIMHCEDQLLFNHV